MTKSTAKQTANIYFGTCLMVKRKDVVNLVPASTLKPGDILMVLVEDHLVDGSVVVNAVPDQSAITICAIRMSLTDNSADHIAVSSDGHVQYPNNSKWISALDLMEIAGNKMISRETYLITVAKCASLTDAIGCFDGNINFY
jgi:hypothetical protein